MCNITRPPCSQSHCKIQTLYQIIETKIKDCFDIKKCTHICLPQQVINDVDLKISLENPNFEDQMIWAKIRDRCDVRRCTQTRPTEQIHVFVSQQVINAEFRISFQNP